jgi:hypothetical protein
VDEPPRCKSDYRCSIFQVAQINAGSRKCQAKVKRHDCDAGAVCLLDTDDDEARLLFVIARAPGIRFDRPIATRSAANNAEQPSIKQSSIKSSSIK